LADAKVKEHQAAFDVGSMHNSRFSCARSASESLIMMFGISDDNSSEAVI